jgi:phage shock protein A
MTDPPQTENEENLTRKEFVERISPIEEALGTYLNMVLNYRKQIAALEQKTAELTATVDSLTAFVSNNSRANRELTEIVSVLHDGHHHHDKAIIKLQQQRRKRQPRLKKPATKPPEEQTPRQMFGSKVHKA